MPRAGVTEKKIVKIAVEITREKGFDAVTMSDISSHFGIRPPSLYKHINGLPQLREKVEQHAVEQLIEKISPVINEKNSMETLKAIGKCLVEFSIEDAGFFDIIEWTSNMVSTKDCQLFSYIESVIKDAVKGLGVAGTEENFSVFTIKNLVLGFTKSDNIEDACDNFEYALDTFLLGIKTRQNLARAREKLANFRNG